MNKRVMNEVRKAVLANLNVWLESQMHKGEWVVETEEDEVTVLVKDDQGTLEVSGIGADDPEDGSPYVKGETLLLKLDLKVVK